MGTNTHKKLNMIKFSCFIALIVYNIITKKFNYELFNVVD